MNNNDQEKIKETVDQMDRCIMIIPEENGKGLDLDYEMTFKQNK